jgi:hypothetical protein
MPPAMLPQTAFAPISSILRDRRFALVYTGGVGLQLGLSALSLHPWQCPILSSTGVPCPGCGLTRAIVLLLQGELRESIHFHAFAPIFLFFSVALVGVLLLPKTISRPIVHKAEVFERQTGLTVIILSALILYWLARLLFLNSAFVQLIRG